MKRRKPAAGNRRRLLIVCLLALAVFGQAAAQCEVKNEAFLPGEDVKYDLYFNWKFIWIKAGKADLSVKATTYGDEPCYQFDLLGVGSKKTDFFFKMRDTLTCIVSDRLEPRYFRKGAEEGKRYTVDEAWFTYSGDGETYVKQKRTYKNGKVRDSADTLYSCVHDMLSILAQARSYDPKDYQVGQKILFPMVTGTSVEEQTLIYRGVENVEANDDKTYRCLVFSFVEYNDKGKEKEVITFYISDDKNHLPVRLDMYLNIGSAKAFLCGVSGNRYPLTSVIASE